MMYQTQTSDLGVSVLEWLTDELRREYEIRQQSQAQKSRIATQFRTCMIACFSGISVALWRFLSI